MRKVYAGLPAVKVEPLLFAPGDISGERLLSMMKVDENARMLPLHPLVASRTHNILDRDAAIHGVYHDDPPLDAGQF